MEYQLPDSIDTACAMHGIEFFCCTLNGECKDPVATDKIRCASPFLTVLNSVHRLRQQNMQFHFRRIEQIDLHDKLLSHSQHIDSLGYQFLVDAIDQWTFLSRYDRDHPSQCNRNRTDQHSFLLNER